MGEKEKVNVDIKSAYKLLHPMHTVLVSCIGKTGKPNITTIAWAMPTSLNPPLVAISISRARAHVDKGVFTNAYDLKKARMIFHLGGNKLATLAPEVFKLES